MNEQRRPQPAAATETDMRAASQSPGQNNVTRERDVTNSRTDDSRPMSEMIGSAVENLQNIVRSEVRLAKTELTEEARLAGKGAAMLAVAAVVGAYAVGLFLLTAVWALATQVDSWLAALIVAIVVTVVAGVLAMVGRSRLQEFNPKPEETIASVKEDIEWAKQQTP